MWNWIEKLAELRIKGQPMVMVTVINCDGSTPREVGAKMFVLPDGNIFGTIGGGQLEEFARIEATNCLEKGISRTIRSALDKKSGQCCGGFVELFMECINHFPQLYIFGAGHVCQAVCRTMIHTPFTLSAIDERSEYIQSERIPKEVRRHQGSWEDFVQEASWDANKTHVVIMTHNHQRDLEILEKVIHLPTVYLGVIGSKSKWSSFRCHLIESGIKEHLLSSVKCPIGIDIGGKAPQEIAISLAAELLKLHYGK